MELIPIFLGGLFFVACAIGGLVYGLFLARGRARWRGLLIVGVGLIGLLPLLMVLPPPFMSLSSLSGTYKGDLGGGEETLVLHPNGTFDQKADDGSGAPRTNRGTWSVSDSQVGSVDFHHLYMPVGFIGMTSQADTEDFGGASVHLVDGAIYFNEDTGLCVRRVK